MIRSNFAAKFVWNISSAPVYVSQDAIVYNDDCRDILADILDSSIDFICTDPPYGTNTTNYQLSKMINNDRIRSLELFFIFIEHAKRILRPGGCCCCFCPSGGGPKPVFYKWVDYMAKKLEYKNTVIWDKDHLGLGSHYRQAYEFILVAKKPGAKCIWNGACNISNLLKSRKPLSIPKSHPTPKPLELIMQLIKLHTNMGNIILDPFAGSGTTMLAAKLLKRKSIGIELDKGYCKLIINRFEKHGMSH